MVSQVKTRPMTIDEKELLSSDSNNLWQIIRNEISLLFGPWVSLILAFILLWALVAWLGRLLFDIDFGWDSSWAPLIWILAIGLNTGWIGYYLVREIYSKSKSRQSIIADLEANEVKEYKLELIAAKRLQEPEHGGLIYFLLTDEQKVFVVYDYESQDLGVDGANPLESSLQPGNELTIVRAPKSGLVLCRHFAGSPLTLDAPRTITVKPHLWPESEEYCDTPWTELEAKYAG